MKKFSLKPALLIGAAIVLLGLSTVNSTQAALTILSDNYQTDFDVKSIGVTLQENGEDIAYRDYLHKDDKWSEGTGELLVNLLPASEQYVQLGEEYDEVLTVKNSGTIDTYVRVILTKSWKDAYGVKDTKLSPELIQLNVLEKNGWFIGEETAERTVLYYKKVLKAGETSPAFTDVISLDPILMTKNTSYTTDLGNGFKEVTVVYDYDGYSFVIDAEVDAVQTHNAKDAIKSAWGIDANYVSQ